MKFELVLPDGLGRLIKEFEHSPPLGAILCGFAVKRIRTLGACEKNTRKEEGKEYIDGKIYFYSMWDYNSLSITIKSSAMGDASF